jgi:hypothetical protein
MSVETQSERLEGRLRHATTSNLSASGPGPSIGLGLAVSHDDIEVDGKEPKSDEKRRRCSLVLCVNGVDAPHSDFV